MREEKQLLLDEIRETIDQSKAIVFASYQKLQPNVAAGFRSTLQKQGGGVEVVRKRILLKAAKASGLSLDIDALQGHIALVFTKEDPVAMTKTIFEFSKNNEDTMAVLAGRVEGQICTGADIEKISKLPTKDEMRAQFLGLLEAPMGQTLAVVDALLSSVIHCLENKAQEQGVST